ncbi:MAG TPA: NAD-dependent malic enzyme [Vicinamibacterales bacterium]|nr:NAD-dependent malic enzyme [Vicinamibacterales bacterium]
MDPVRQFEERRDPHSGDRYLAVFTRGAALEADPALNKGTCFTREERAALGLTGLLPPAVQSPDEQLARAYGNYLKAADDVARYVFLAGLQDRNETLFCRLVQDHLEEMVPIIYTPTVGKACEQYSHIYRHAHGVYITPDECGHIAEVLQQVRRTTPPVIVITDNEAILGIGDQGVGGMPIAIGKLALYTVGAGIHPARCLPIDLDVGTDNAARLGDPIYLGIRARRLRGAPYFALLDELVDAIARVYPGALVQWEDFASANAFDVLARYRRRLLSFNDDIQGTGAVVVAGIESALRQTGGRLQDARVMFFGAGASGAGSALAVRSALRDAGVPAAELSARVVCLDSKGLILSDRPGLSGVKRDIAADRALAAGWTAAPDGTFGLAEVARGYRPTVLVGASGQPGAFTESIVRDMLAGCPRPIVLALSNPDSKTEVTPADLIRWTNGAAVTGTGSPFAPVEHGGRTYTIGQGNNAFIFPGVGLGATAVGAQWLPDVAFVAAARALVSVASTAPHAGAPIYPPLNRLREVSRAVATAVGAALVDAGAAPPLSAAEIERRVLAAMWEPRYLPYRAAHAPALALEQTTSLVR